MFVLVLQLVLQIPHIGAISVAWPYSQPNMNWLKLVKLFLIFFLQDDKMCM